MKFYQAKKFVAPALLLGASVAPALNAKEAQKPNIIFILADDLGYGDLGCFGQEIIKTPNLDKLAKNGIKFTQHYSGSTVCGPSRSCLLTGQHSGHTFLRGNGKLDVREDPQDIIIPRILKKAGYHTAMIGKSGVACNSQDGGLPNRKGFDFFFGHSSHTDAHWYYPPKLWKNGEKVKYPKNTLHEGDTYAPEAVMNEVLNYVEEQKDGPFFLHYALQLPHVSLRAPEEFIEMYRGKIGKEVSTPKRHYSGTKEVKATYAAMVTYMDHNVGRLVDKLKELGIDKNTLIIFSSDNGPASEGGYRRDYFNSNGELRGGKRDLYEGGVRVPTIAYWPGTVKPNQVSDHISAFWDFVPTACEIAGLKKPANSDGISYLPTLLGKKQKKHDYLYWEFHEWKGSQAVRMGKWKAVRLGTKKNPNPPIELYNLETDLGEKKNIAKDFPEVVERMRKAFNEAHTESSIFKLASEKK